METAAVSEAEEDTLLVAEIEALVLGEEDHEL